MIGSWFAKHNAVLESLILWDVLLSHGRSARLELSDVSGCLSIVSDRLDGARENPKRRRRCALPPHSKRGRAISPSLAFAKRLGLR